MSSHQLQEAEPAEVAGFIAKTFQILSNQEFGKIIFWGASGREFVIKDVSKFQQVVLPRYFRHSKMNSFIRQLNMYGFHKSRNELTKSVFSHPLFHRDRPDLLITIKRKIKGKIQAEEQKQEQPIQTPHKKRQNQSEITTGKELAETGRELRSTKQLSFEEPNRMSTFNYLFASKERLGSRLNLNVSMRKLSSREAGNGLRLDQESECVSIEEKIEKSDKNERQKDNGTIKFLNPSCFFTSIRK